MVKQNENKLTDSVSRRTFLAGGGAVLGLTLLSFGCRNNIADPTASIASTGKSGIAPELQQSVHDVVLDARPVELEIASGRRINAWTYDGKLPGTEIRAQQGERLRITLKNNLPESTSIHWHGFAQKGTSNMDGVPSLTQPPIPPAAIMVYDFIASSPGTYFYHPHSGLQIERGLYAPIIVEAKKEALTYDREYTLVLDDWLAGSPDVAFEQLRQGISPADGLTDGSSSRSSDANEMGMGMRHGGNMDEGEGCCANEEVEYSCYLMNGRSPEAPPEFQVKRGDRVRFRVINAGAATVFRMAIQEHKLIMTHSDGFPLRTVGADAFEISPGERYDFLITANNPGAWAIVAAPTGQVDRAARGVLRYTDAKGTSDPERDFVPGELNGEVLDLDQLMSADDLDYPHVADGPDRQIDLTLSGGGEHSYDWLINGKKGLEEPFEVRTGERVRMRISNHTMTWHPMHLHGHSFRLLNEASRNEPVKDTVLVKPTMHGRAEFEFVADNPGSWLIHCHQAYHLAAGMERLIKYRQ